MSKILIHKSPQGALAIVGVPGVVEPGEPFKTDDDTAASLLVQSELYRVASKADIQEHADRKAAEEAAAAEAAKNEGDPE